MNILIINHMETRSPGGINKTVIELATNLSKKGHLVTILQPNPLDLSSNEEYNGFRIIRIKSFFHKLFYEFNPKVLFNLNDILNSLNPDIVHIHGYLTLFSTSILFYIKRIKPDLPIIMSPHFAITSHNTFAGKYMGFLYNLIVGKKILQYPDLIIAASLFESNNINHVLDVPVEKVRVIPHGVNTINLNKKKINRDCIKLLYVGYLIKLKGVQHIIKVLKELINYAPVELTVVGEGPYKVELANLAKELGVDSYIIWKKFIPLGNSEELLKYYVESDFTLLLSSSENFGVVVIESLAVGTPVIVSKRESLNEFLQEPGCFGVDYPPNPKKVANLIWELYTNNTVTTGPFSKKIRTWAEVTEDYESVYSNVLGEF